MHYVRVTEKHGYDILKLFLLSGGVSSRPWNWARLKICHILITTAQMSPSKTRKRHTRETHRLRGNMLLSTIKISGWFVTQQYIADTVSQL